MSELTGAIHRQVEDLGEIGRTYSHKGSEVVPSQAYAQFCGKPTKEVNRALNRISKAGRLVSGEDFFTLNVEESAHLTRCQPVTFQSNHGLTLLTHLAVNTLSHYFDDAASVAHSKRVNRAGTKVLETAPDSGQDEEDQRLMMIANLALSIVGVRKQNRRMSAEIQEVRVMADQSDSVLSSSQVSELDEVINNRYRELNLPPRVCGLIKRRLKAEFFAQTSTRTYKEIPRSGFQKAKAIIREWYPTELERRDLAKLGLFTLATTEENA